MDIDFSQTQKLKKLLAEVPQTPGVYFFKGKDGKILYIGKAKNLRARVKQYFSGGDERPQIPYLVKDAKELDFTVVSSELESLYLERTLIQKYLPKYNIELKDDKSYAFITFDYLTQIPQILITRQSEYANNDFETLRFYKNKNLTASSYKLTANSYFGPYSAAYKARQILKSIRYIFPYCTNTKVSNKPCFYFHLHRCPGVCVGQMSLEEYNKHLNNIKLFLKGDIKTVQKKLESEMRQAAGKKLFEKAARLRNQLRAIENVEQKQSVIIPKKVSWDIVALDFLENTACVTLFKVREGKLADKENFFYSINVMNQNAPKNEFLEKFLEDFYSQTSEQPNKIYLKSRTENAELIEKLLKARFGKSSKILAATKLQPLDLYKMAENNAREALKQRLSQTARDFDRTLGALNRLKEILKLPATPKRIEGYDISNIQGTNPVGSMVVFKDGLAAKSQYRKFKIEGKSTPDDFAMMKEMLTRRFERIDGKFQISNTKFQINQKSEILNSKPSWPVPDLIVIDGGRGQLNVALKILQASSYNLNSIPIIGLAKKIEEIFLPGKKEPIILPHDDPALQLLQRLRDEAHRFGITFHRTLRSKQAVKSALDNIPGVGPKTKKLLKSKFGTVAQIRQASLEELSQVVNPELAKVIKQNL